MMRIGGKFSVALVALLLAAGALGWLVLERFDEQGAARVRASGATKAVPVEVAPVQRGPMELKRTFSGALQARAQFVVAPKVSGRVERLYVNLADAVTRGQVVAELDNDEYVQAVAQARANLAVAQANVAGAQSALDMAARELERMQTLRQRGMASEAQFDTATANQLDKKSQLAVAQALVSKAESELRSADIRLGYTKVTAGWRDGSGRRFVAERFVDEGETVTANGALLSIVELDAVVAVIFVAERDYARLDQGQLAVLTTDAFPGKRFEGRIERIAPVFREASRQARVELIVANEKLALKPGMFVRATVVLDRIADATHVPEQALTARNGEDGVFVVSEDGRSVAWQKVDVGIREDGRVQVTGKGVAGRVVVLGQQLLEDGSMITLPGEDRAASLGGVRPDPNLPPQAGEGTKVR
jgi:RND family efflux transporter MFP subunit